MVLAGGALLAPAHAQQPTPPVAYPEAPEAFSVSGREAYEIAAEEPEVAELTAKLGQLSTREEVRDDGRWQVGFFARTTTRSSRSTSTAAAAASRDLDGRQVAWPMARGYEGQFGHALNAP